jgi:hypothetical protein
MPCPVLTQELNAKVLVLLAPDYWTGKKSFYQPIIDARDLHKLMGIKAPFERWMNRKIRTWCLHWYSDEVVPVGSTYMLSGPIAGFLFKICRHRPAGRALWDIHNLRHQQIRHMVDDVKSAIAELPNVAAKDRQVACAGIQASIDEIDRLNGLLKNGVD